MGSIPVSVGKIVFMIDVVSFEVGLTILNQLCMTVAGKVIM